MLTDEADTRRERRPDMLTLMAIFLAGCALVTMLIALVQS